MTEVMIKLTAPEELALFGEKMDEMSVAVQKVTQQITLMQPHMGIRPPALPDQIRTEALCVLQRAKMMIETRGWVQGHAQSPAGVCAGHAVTSTFIALYANDGEVGQHVESLFLNAMYELTGSIWHGSIPAWNDFPARTRQEVLDTFDRALKLGGLDG